jgi:sugar transferase (PEP-CTERM/EpsH1 system associated)
MQSAIETHEAKGSDVAAAIRRIRPAAGAPTICQLVHGLPVGGAEVLIDRIVRQLGDRYRFIIACLDEVGPLGERLAGDGISVVNLERRPGFDWKCVRRLHRLLRTESVQVTHAHQCTPFAYALATRAFGKRPAVLLTEHGRFFPDAASRRRKLFHRLLSRRDDQFVAVGETVRQALVNNEGLPRERIQVVYNGVRLPEGQAEATDRAAVRAELGIDDGEIVIIQVARLDAIKDHATGVQAFAIAHAQNPRLRLLVVGDGPERPAIERTIREHALQARVSMLGMRDDVRRLLAAADLFLLTSVSEGIPVTVLEAMAEGVPVVATDVGGLPELIRHGESGLLAPPGNAEKLAEALMRLASGPSFRAQLASHARHRAATQFSEQGMMTRYDQIYQGMLNHGANN